MTRVPAPMDPIDAFGLVRSFTRHVAFVKLAVHTVSDELERRAIVHDMSKMLDDEFAGFTRINAAARINKFGSPEYADGMRREKATIDQHFGRNTHHAEYFATHPEHLTNHPGCELACGMSFLDVIEMVCDWWGAGKGYDDPRPWRDSVQLNIKQKGKHLTPEQLWLVSEVAAFLGSRLSSPVGRVAPFHTPENPVVEQQTHNSAPCGRDAVVSTES